jgi:membrane associated rhomboid family serine protease
VIGLLLLAGLGLSIAHWQMGGSIEDMRNEGAMLFSGMAAMMAAVGLVFGLLLALITGREHAADPLLELESTGGDVSVALED